MANHFHLLVEVPNRDAWLERFTGPHGEAKLLDHLRILYSKTYVDLLRADLAELRRLGLESRAQQKLLAIKKRFCDLSIYIKEVKERFSRWFNKRRGRRGTLWMDRFKSILVEGRGEALRTMAAYIDLNPVRAGLTNDPKDYRWCGYAEALSGSRRAQRGLCKAVARPVDSWGAPQTSQAYRRLLHTTGAQVKNTPHHQATSSGISAERARQVLAQKGKLTTAELIRLRVRYFTDGLVLGSRAFVETAFRENRAKFGPKRTLGPRPLTETTEALFSLRRLRRQPVT